MYRSGAIPCAGPVVYRPRHRAEWLAKIVEPGVRLRAERLYQQLDALEPLAAGSTPRPASGEPETSGGELLRQIPYLGPIVPRCCGAARDRAASFSHQATAVGLQRILDSRLTTVANTVM